MPVIVENRYYALPDHAVEALATRRRASQLRRMANKPTGRILLPLTAGGSTPTFVWQCEYPDVDSRMEDANWAETSPQFQEIANHMATLLSRFERYMYETDDV